MSQSRFLLVELTPGFEQENIEEILDKDPSQQWDPFAVQLYGDMGTAQDDASFILESRNTPCAIFEVSFKSVTRTELM